MAANLNEFFTCSICLDNFSYPKQLACFHHYCRTCLDDILKFQVDESAIIECPQRCQEVTHIGKMDTTNSLRATYDFRGAVEAFNAGSRSVDITRCQYEENCNKAIVLFCCGSYMCRQCGAAHLSNQDVHKNNAQVYIDEKTNKTSVLCKEHAANCAYFCTNGEGFVCKYCVNRGHKTHKAVTIEERSLSLKGVLFEDSRKSINVTESIAITEREMNSIKGRLDEALRERKVACILDTLIS